MNVNKNLDESKQFEKEFSQQPKEKGTSNLITKAILIGVVFVVLAVIFVFYQANVNSTPLAPDCKQVHNVFVDVDKSGTEDMIWEGCVVFNGATNFTEEQVK